MYLQRKVVLSAFTSRNFLCTNGEQAGLHSASGSLSCHPCHASIPDFRPVSVCLQGVPPAPWEEMKRGVEEGLGCGHHWEPRQESLS